MDIRQVANSRLAGETKGGGKDEWWPVPQWPAPLVRDVLAAYFKADQYAPEAVPDAEGEEERRPMPAVILP